MPKAPRTAELARGHSPAAVSRRPPRPSVDAKRRRSPSLLWANTDKLQYDKAYQDTTVKFLEASFKGWAFCRDNPDNCRDIVVARGSKLGASHQLWPMNEINKLIWPSPNGIGMVDKSAWDQAVKIAEQTKNQQGDPVLKNPPEGLAYTNDYAQKAIAALKEQGVDTSGTDFEPITVTLNPGGS